MQSTVYFDFFCLSKPAVIKKKKIKQILWKTKNTWLEHSTDKQDSLVPGDKGPKAGMGWGSILCQTHWLYIKEIARWALEHLKLNRNFKTVVNKQPCLSQIHSCILLAAFTGYQCNEILLGTMMKPLKCVWCVCVFFLLFNISFFVPWFPWIIEH